MKNKLFLFFFYGKTRKERIYHFIFVLGMFAKCFEGILEVIMGLAVEILSMDKIATIISNALKSQQLFQIDNHTIFKWVESVSQILTDNYRLFLCIILTGTGVIKIALSIGLLMRKYIAYPIALSILTLLYLYQIGQTIYEPSPLLYYLDVYNLLIILLIWRQFLTFKRRLHG